MSQKKVEGVIIKRSNYAHLEGNPISLTEASRKYDIPIPTLSLWARRGALERLGKRGRRVLVNEADVAYAAAIREAQGEKGRGRGARIFDRQGRPYVSRELRNRATIIPTPDGVVVIGGEST